VPRYLHNRWPPREIIRVHALLTVRGFALPRAETTTSMCVGGGGGLH
jgi:hypothetical protein